MTYADADELLPQARRLGSTPFELPAGGSLNLRTGLADVVEQTSDRIASTYALLALALSGLGAVLVAVFALAVQTLLARRRSALALASARGAGEVQVRGSMVLEGLLLAGPVSVLVVSAVAALMPANVGPWVEPSPVVTALLVPVLCGLLTSARSVRQPRQDLQVRTGSQVRWVLEVGVVGLAALSLLAVERRGVVESSRAVGIDPLVVAAPALLATAVCVVVLRAYPSRSGCCNDGCGLAAARSPCSVRPAPYETPRLGFAAALALVVGMSVVTFSAVMASTMRSGLEHSVREAVGADVRLSAERFEDSDVDDVRRLPGVDAAARLSVRSGVELDLGRTAHVDVVVADTSALHAVRPDVPVLVPQGPAGPSLLLGTDRDETPRTSSSTACRRA